MGQDCKYCGAYIAGNVDRCPACGKRIKASDRQSGYGYAAAVADEREEIEERDERREEQREASRVYTYKDEYDRRYGSGETRDAAAQEQDRRKTESSTDAQCVHGQARARYTFDDDDARKNRAISFLCYLGPLFLIPYLTRSDSDFVKFHSNQGLALLIANIVVGWFGGMLGVIGGVFCFACFLIGMSSVGKGEKKPLPLIGKFNLLR